MDGNRLTENALVLLGEIENTVRALRGRSKGARISVPHECSYWLTPELQTKLETIYGVRNDMLHNGSHSRPLFEQDQPLFSNESVDELQTIHTQLLEAKERQTGYAAELEEQCTQFPTRDYWSARSVHCPSSLGTLHRTYAMAWRFGKGARASTTVGARRLTSPSALL